MKFSNAPDDPTTGLHHRLVSESGIVEIGIYDVLFGHRVRAGFVGDPTCQVDWCCGRSANHVWSHYFAITLLLRRRNEDHDCFDDIPPTSAIKPCYTDPVFSQTLTDLMLKDPDVTERRYESINN